MNMTFWKGKFSIAEGKPLTKSERFFVGFSKKIQKISKNCLFFGFFSVFFPVFENFFSVFQCFLEKNGENQPFFQKKIQKIFRNFQKKPKKSRILPFFTVFYQKNHFFPCFFTFLKCKSASTCSIYRYTFGF